MQNKKYQIFISSTYEDLKEERQAVLKAILNMKHFPIGMEMFNAGNDQQWKIITDTIDKTDYYVLILGKRYGSILKDGADRGISYTEREYRYAQKHGVPVIAFIINDDALVSTAVIKELEDDPNKGKQLKRFKEDVTSHHMVEWFRSPEELAQKVTNALYQAFDQTERPGWVRSEDGVAEKISLVLAEDNKRIRELEDENRRLRNMFQDRKPILSVSLQADTADSESRGDNDHPEFFKTSPAIAINDDGDVNITIIKVRPIDCSYRYAPLELDDEATKLGVTQQQIDEYNRNLPSADDINKIQESITAYKQLETNGFAVKVVVNNKGTAKATDVRVNIKVPSIIFVDELENAEELKKPQLPKLTNNPIEEAQKRGLEEKLGLGILGNTKFIPEHMNSYLNFPASSLISQMTFNRNNIHKYSGVKGNEIILEADQVLHPEGKEFAHFLILPKKEGCFILECEIMCSEFSEPIYQQIVVNVTEK